MYPPGPGREIRVNDGACFKPSSPMWHGEKGPHIQISLRRLHLFLERSTGLQDDGV